LATLSERPEGKVVKERSNTKHHDVKNAEEGQVVRVGPYDRFIVVINFNEGTPEDEIQQTSAKIAKFMDGWVKSPSRYCVITAGTHKIRVETSQVALVEDVQRPRQEIILPPNAKIR